ncbi:MAG: type 1 glutamine amidotransferase [Acidobacteria bacterium]|nr:type 1 glutamine amidotransferase [Acidobacteriota bacterium]
MGCVAVLRHVPFEHLGLISDSLAENGLAFEYIDMFEASAPAALDSYAAVVSMGGPMSANDDLPFLRRELDWIRDAAARGKPVLGVCLGAQMIARALGARVYRNPVKEIGWFPVHLTEDGVQDPVLGALAASEAVFHWHGETFDLPEGARLLARSDACRHQAFRAGANVYGLQFHLETTPEMISDWLGQPDNRGDVESLAAPVDPRQGGERLARAARQVFDRWCGLI